MTYEPYIAIRIEPTDNGWKVVAEAYWRYWGIREDIERHYRTLAEARAYATAFMSRRVRRIRRLLHRSK